MCDLYYRNMKAARIEGDGLKGLFFKNDAAKAAERLAKTVLSGVRQARDCEIEIAESDYGVQKNSRYGREIRLGGRTYARGLCCHAPASLRINAGKPVSRFTASVNITDLLSRDPHEEYNSGPLWPKARVIAYDGEGKVLYCSGLLAGGAGEAVGFDLNGASNFILTVAGVRPGESGEFKPENWSGPAGDAASGEINEWCDMCFGDAKLVFADGTEQYLNELTMEYRLLPDMTEPPFSFIYGGRKSGDFLSGWRRATASEPLPGGRTKHIVTYADPETALEVRFEAVAYDGHPAFEWTLYFKNNGAADTPEIGDINALDLPLERGYGAEYMLHYNLGGVCRFDDYHPYTETLPAHASKHFGTLTGFGSDPYMPYFNIEDGAGEGLICAVGWPCNWRCDLTRDGGQGLRITAGQADALFYLRPGEEARSPLILLMPWRGDFTGAQNAWRRFMVDWGIPRTDGKPPKIGLTASDDNLVGFGSQSEEIGRQFIDGYEREGIRLASWWTDYLWHTNGNPDDLWVSDRTRFPDGLGALNGYAKSKGMTSIVWLAPECRFFGNHPEWLISGTMSEPLGRGGTVSVIDFGNRDALEWLIESHDAVIKREKIGIYRIDSGMGPLAAWRGNDEPGRAGLAENRYAAGLLRFFDELIARNPGLEIDNCCRGGRRLDLESCRRSYPLWRSDHCGTAVSNQLQTYGLSMWLPYFGTAAFGCDVYNFRSSMCPSTTFSYDDTRRADLAYDVMRKNASEFYGVADAFYGDYYPLTAYNDADGGWMAYQFYLPERGEGFALFFRRGYAADGEPDAGALRFPLGGLDPGAEYTVTDFDAGEAVYPGAELTERGLSVSADPNSAKLYRIKRRQD